MGELHGGGEAMPQPAVSSSEAARVTGAPLTEGAGSSSESRPTPESSCPGAPLPVASAQPFVNDSAASRCPRGLAVVLSLLVIILIGIGAGLLASQLAVRSLEMLGITPEEADAETGVLLDRAVSLLDTGDAQGSREAQDGSLAVAPSAGEEGSSTSATELADEQGSEPASNTLSDDGASLGERIGGALSNLTAGGQQAPTEPGATA